MRKQVRWLALVALGLGACSSVGGPDAVGTDGNNASDAGPACGTIISFDPDPLTQPAYADPVAQIQASVNVVGAPGVFTYKWSVSRSGTDVSFDPASSDGSRSSSTDSTLNVGDPNANTNVFRFRTVPSGSTPPQEQVIQIAGGADYVRDILLDPGLAVNLAVQDGTGAGVPSYVKMMPVAAPNAFVELFTNSNGTFATRLQGQNHTALVIPESTAYAPALVTWMPTSTGLTIGAGNVVTGVVTGPSGSGLSGAKVQLMSGIVPSTTATTAIDGSFSLRESFASGSSVTVRVTPSSASGLPRLESTGTFNLSTSMQITYSASLATCDLSNTPVKRSGSAQAGAKVTVVGTLAGSSGSVAAGVTLAATGTVHVAATADGTGKLPSTLVPRAPLSAVVQLATTDYAVSALDTSTCAATTIDAPPQIVRTGTAKNASAAVLSGVNVEATPIGALAAADAQTVSSTTDAGGGFSISLASGGFYDVRFVDPYARAARLLLPGIAAAGVPSTATLPTSLVISGKVSVSGTGQPIVGASIQLLCATCTGIDATRPIAQTASDGLSTYKLAVPDPGTM